MKKFAEKKYENRRVYLAVISSVALACGGTVLAQANIVAEAGAAAPSGSTNLVISGSSTNVTQLGNIPADAGKFSPAARRAAEADGGAPAKAGRLAQIPTPQVGATSALAVGAGGTPN